MVNGQWIRRITTLGPDALDQPIQDPAVLAGLNKTGAFIGQTELPGVFSGPVIYVESELPDGISIVLAIGINTL